MHRFGTRLECLTLPYSLSVQYSTHHSRKEFARTVTEKSASASRPEEVLLMSSMQSDLILRVSTV